MQEQHQAAGHRQCRGAAEVRFHQGQRQVDARGDPGRGEYMGVAVPAARVVGVQAVALYLDALMATERFHVRPVGGGLAPLQQAGRGENQGTRADGAQAAYVRLCVP
ncbi:hypothetical protein D9M70_435690 [compost metagenome]